MVGEDDLNSIMLKLYPHDSTSTLFVQDGKFEKNSLVYFLLKNDTPMVSLAKLPQGVTGQSNTRNGGLQ